MAVQFRDHTIFQPGVPNVSSDARAHGKFCDQVAVFNQARLCRSVCVSVCLCVRQGCVGLSVRPPKQARLLLVCQPT